MSDETMVLETTETTETTSQPVSGATSDVSREMSDGDIQSLMMSAWEDPGLGAVVDGDGVEIINKATGKPFRNMNEFNAAVSARGKGQSQPTQKAQESKQVEQNKPAQTAQPKQEETKFVPSDPFEGRYIKDGAVDYGALKSDWGNIASARFQSPGLDMAQAVQQQAQAAPAKPASPYAEVDALRAKMESDYLEPLQRIAAEIGAQPGTPQFDALNKEYMAKKAMIDELARTKERELSIRYTDEKLSSGKLAMETERLAKEAESNVSKVATEVFGQKGTETFWKLLVGTTDASGKVIERGVAADLLDEKFAIATDFQKFAGANEYQKAYQNWFAKYASNPNNLRFLARQAFNEWAAVNRDHIVSNARKAGEKVAATRQAVKQPAPTGNAPQGGAVLGNDVMSLWNMKQL